MEVKVYIEEQKAELITEPEQWIKQVEELGLEGQKMFITETAKAGKGINPFMRMSPEMVRVYKELCPDQDEIKEFRGEPIPMKALSAVALAQKEGWFKRIQVWHRYGHPDPFIVGAIDGFNSWDDKGLYLLAQWGPELETFAQAKVRAVRQWSERFRAQLQERLSDWAARMNSADGLNASALRFFETAEKPDVDIPF